MDGRRAERAVRRAGRRRPGPVARPRGREPTGAEEVASADRLSVGYRGHPVWSDASFRIGRGELVAVIGPNGAGKTTLFRLLLGQIAPTRGELRVFGAPARRGNPSIGYVPQNHVVDRETNVEARQLVRLGYSARGWTDRSTARPLGGAAGAGSPRALRAVVRRTGHTIARGAARAGSAARRWLPPLTPAQRRAEREATDEALRLVGAGDLGSRALGALSGGELQRIFLAEALVGGPRLLLLDEPLANLDLRRARELVELVHTLVSSRGVSTLLVAHDINPLIRCLDKVIYVANGRVATGPPEEVLTTESLSALYGVPVEVLRDSRGNLVIVGGEDSHQDPAA